MSNNFTCREKYYNYGSYLRSRGYDKEICNLVSAIEHGDIPIGPITPGNCGVSATIIQGDVNIIPCPIDLSSGILKVNGGSIGQGNTNNLLSESLKYGVQSLNGLKVTGPMFQTTDCSHSNYFAAGNHIFVGGNLGVDCSTNVIIDGNLDIYGDMSINKLTVYDLSVINVLTVGTSTTYIDTSNVVANNGEIVDLSVNNHAVIYDLSVNNSITVINNIDVSNNLLIGGDIVGTNGDLNIAGFTGDVSIVAGTPPFYGNDIVLKASNIDFSGANVNFIDISDNVTFNKNPVINNGTNYSNRIYQNYGESTTIIDICNNTGSGISWNEGTHDLSFNSIVYSDFSGAHLIYDISDNIIDFSNNQNLAKDTLYEVNIQSRVVFNANAEAISYEFKELGTSNKVYIDTRSIQKNRDYTICFGPAFFVFQTGQPDNDYLSKQFTFSMDISGNSAVVDLITPPRLTIKQKSLV